MNKLTACLLLTLAVTASASYSVNFNGHYKFGDQVVDNRQSYLHMLKSSPSADFTNQQNFFMCAMIGIGTPAQSFSLTLDTGSSDVWVPSTDCTCETTSGSSCSCLNVATEGFVPSDSSTYSNVGTSIDLPYGSIEVKGTLAKDTVDFGDNLKVANQYLSIIDSETLSGGNVCDGILGLAFESIAGSKEPTFVDTADSEGYIDERVFTLYFDKDTETKLGKADSNGWRQVEYTQASTDNVITLGEADTTHASGDFTWVDLYEELWYLTKVDKLYAGNTKIGSGAETIIDSGTSLIYLLEDDWNNFYDEVQNSVGSDGQCETQQGILYCVFTDESSIKNLPDFTVEWSGNQFTLTAEQYSSLLAVNEDNGEYEYLIEMVATSQAPAILGDTFMINYVCAFDMDNGRVGFAELEDVAGTIKTVEDNTTVFTPTVIAAAAGGLVVLAALLVKFLF